MMVVDRVRGVPLGRSTSGRSGGVASASKARFEHLLRFARQTTPSARAMHDDVTGLVDRVAQSGVVIDDRRARSSPGQRATLVAASTASTTDAHAELSSPVLDVLAAVACDAVARAVREMACDDGVDAWRHEVHRLAQRLVQGIVASSRGRGGTWSLTLLLAPDVLGGAMVSLNARPGQLSVRFQCRNARSREQLDALLDVLRDRLLEVLARRQPVEVTIDVSVDEQVVEPVPDPQRG
jgi:flagellar hook-length control protein FliK